MAQAPSTDPAGVSIKRTFGVACALIFLAAADQTTVSTALPSIAEALGGSEQYPIVFTAYMASTAATVPIGGKLGDLRGRRPILSLAVVLFTLAAGLSAASPSIELLAGARILQGIGAGLIIANAYALVGDIVPMAQLGRYNGLLTGIFGLASLLGPILGGILTDGFGWRSIFLINFPLGAIALLSLRQLPASSPQLRPPGGLDLPGAILLAISLVAIILTLGALGKEGSAPTPIAIGALVCGVLVAALVVQERRATAPIISPVAYRDPVMATALIVTFFANASLYIVALYVPLFLQGPLGHSPTQAGIRVTPLVLSLIVFSVVGGIAVARAGTYRRITLAGLLLGALGILGLAYALPLGGTGPIALALVITGAGLGLALPSLTLVCQNTGAQGDLGISTGLSRTSATIGGVVGVSLAGLLIVRIQGTSTLEAALTQATLFAALLMAISWVACLKLGDKPLRETTSTEAPSTEPPSTEPPSTEPIDLSQTLLRGEHP